MCQTTTSAVTFMCKNLGYSCTNYTADFGEQRLLINWPPLSRPWVIYYIALGWVPLSKRIHLRLLWWSSLVSSSMQLRWPSHHYWLSFRASFTLCISALCDVCFTTRPAALAWHHVFCHPLCTSPAHVLCCHCFTPSDHTGCLNTALFQVLITLIYAGSVTSYRTTMVSRSLRLRLGWTIISSSPRTYAAPLHMCSNVNVSLWNTINYDGKTFYYYYSKL